MKNLALIGLFMLCCACRKDDAPRNNPVPLSGPIQLHPENPHYFLYQGKPTLLITSAEHYGAVLNGGFDYQRYLQTLAEDGMNYTRIFAGSYFEIYGESFGISHNTLAPKKEDIITPWAIVISDLSGEIKYDLNTWNTGYFDRLKDFLSLAAEKNIFVEVTLFSSIYNDNHWAINPQNPKNNININQEIDRRDAQTLNNGPLLQFQEKWVRKMVRELNEFDHFFFEIQNEPWADRAVPVYNIVNKDALNPKDWTYKADFADQQSMLWQDKMISYIKDEESQLSNQHLIAQNYTNYKAPVPSVNEDVSIINFHYAWPEAVEWNYQYDKVIGFDESGFAGSGDDVYRRQAWQFMLSGGGLFNNLDYSFFAGHEDGLGENEAPGGGSKTLRKQLKILHEFLDSFELEKLNPSQHDVVSSPGLIPYVLSNKNISYAIFLRAIGTSSSSLKVNTTQGKYVVITLNTIEGTYSEPTTIEAVECTITLDLDIPDGELAIKVVKE